VPFDSKSLWLGILWATGAAVFITIIAASLSRPSVVFLVILGIVFFSTAVLLHGWSKGWIAFVVVPMFIIGFLAWPRVTITPHTLVFRNGAEYTFTIKNNVEVDVYTVVAKIAGVNIAEFELDSPSNTGKPRTQRTPDPTDVRVIACKNKEGNYILYINIYHLSPGESRGITLSHTTPDVISIQTLISNYTTEPQPIYNKPQKGITPFVTDENCNIYAVLPQLR
jgi:hypothetical protein